MCPEPSCAGARIDLEPGDTEELLWDGAYWEGSARGCRQSIGLAPGTQLTFKVCWGKPEGDYDVVFSGSPSCITASFAYGDSVVDVELP